MTQLDEKLNEDLPLMLQSINIKLNNITDVVYRIKNFYFTNGRMEKDQEQNLCYVIKFTNILCK